MKLSRSMFLFLFVFACLASAPFAVGQDEVLTNVEVISLTKAGLDKALIINKIKTSKTNFDLSTDDLVKLKQARVADEVVNAMLETKAGNAKTVAEQPQKPPLTGFGLQDGTPLKLRINRTMSSADAKTGETIDFEVLEDVKVGDILVIPRGGVALGTVTEAKPKGRMGKGGKLNINIDSVRLVSGEKVALRAVKETKGGSHTGAMTGAIVATSIVFFPAAPFFLFMKGKDITIPKGTEITAYINGDVSLDQKRFASGQTDQTSASAGDQASSANSAGSSSVLIKSTPDGAEIDLDGKFTGSTPSTLSLKFGEHKISIKKAGYILWERTITISAGGSINVEATLEKTP